MTSASPSQPTDGNRLFKAARRRSATGLRPIEVPARSVSGYAPMLSVGRFVGRVGALAVALGVGAAVGAPVLAGADTTGSAGSSGSGAESSSGSSSGSSSRGAARSRPSGAGVRRGARVAGAAGVESGQAGPAPASGAEDVAGSGRGSVAPESELAVGEVPVRSRGQRSDSPAMTTVGDPEVGVVDAPAAVPEVAEPVVGSVPVARSAAAAGVEAAGDSAAAAAAVVAAPVDGAAVMTAPPAAVSGSVSGLGAELLSWLGAGGDGPVPAAGPLMWAVAGFTRRDGAKTSAGVAAAASTSSGEPAGLGSVVSPTAAATGGLTANPITDFIRFFIGSGTADNPNAGILWGNGYSYTAASCTGGQACTGGNGGLFGNGGSVLRLS